MLQRLLLAMQEGETAGTGSTVISAGIQLPWINARAELIELAQGLSVINGGAIIDHVAPRERRLVAVQ
jgi:hypothetical protein